MKPASKSDLTRGRILNAALDLFRSQGFETTTMREIAAEAGVATGAAYYYFDSKDAIVLAFYDHAQEEMTPRLEAVLEETRDLRERIARTVQVKFDYFHASRALLGALSSHTDPQHPLSPFSEETKHIRDKDTAFFNQALAGSRVRVPADLKDDLPRILWIYQMGLILFWIYDRSPGQKRTQALLNLSLDIVIRLIKLSSLPLMQPVRRKVRELVETVSG